MKKSGLVHIYTGDGKGKTTSALGLALRAIGWDKRVCVFQFLKKGINGEAKAAALSKGSLKIITFDQTHPAFYHKSLREKARDALQKKIPSDMKAVKETLIMGNYDIVILDEIVNCIAEGLVKKEEALALINLKFRTSELVLTGRGAPKWLIKKADYVTEMRLIKHPYKRGLKARKGIEY